VAIGFIDRLLQCIKDFKQIANETPPPGFDPDGLYDYLHRRADINAQNMIESNTLIEGNLRPLLENPGQLGDEDADALSALAQELFSLTGVLDIALAQEIHLGLLARARQNDDLDRIIRHLYWAGLTFQQCNPLLFQKEAASYFAQGAVFADRYYEVENKETRRYIHRCLANVYVCFASERHRNTRTPSAPFLAKVDEAIRFWNDDAIRAKDPDFPWESYISNAHQNICGWVDVLVSLPADQVDPALAARVYESAMWLVKNGTFGVANRFWPQSRMKYIELIARYATKRISLQSTLDTLSAMIRQTAKDDYSEEGLFCVLHLPAVIIALLEQAPEVPKERAERETDMQIAQVLEYTKNVPASADRQRLNDSLGKFVQQCVMTHAESTNYLDLLLRFTSLSHMSTYVHSIQVKNISEILTRYLLRHSPAFFAGLRGEKNILELVRHAGLCHDIGKITFINTVALSYRRLYDFEFTIIKDHVSASKKLNAADNIMRCVKDVIAGHHMWYDGSHGYPVDFDNRASPFACIIDIISVADSIDAATDTVGRTYAKAHTLAQIIAEIQSQKGTRYSPVIAEALFNPALYDEINKCIMEGRKNVYYQAYVDLTSRDVGNAI
jgi:response regulator RpfG family c-di-GMP phosphodiesterase